MAMEAEVAAHAGVEARPTVAYIRVSTEKQQREGYSLEDQRRRCAAYPALYGWPAIPEDGYYVDVETGSTQDRPALGRLLADARAGRVGRVVCTAIDRMGRDTIDFLVNERELESCGVERAYIKEHFDTSTPVGRMMRTIMAAMAEMERATILERTRNGQLAKVRRGEIWRVPYGYRYMPGDKRAADPAARRGQVLIDEGAAPLIRRVFGLVAGGMTCMAVAALLTAEGVPTARGGRMWRHSVIRQIIRNPAYSGQAAYGRLRNVAPSGKARLRAAPVADVLYAPVPALVPEQMQEAAIAMLARNRQLARRNTRRPHLLRGLVTCGRCGMHHDELHRQPHRRYSMQMRTTSYQCTRLDPATGRKAGPGGAHSVGCKRLERAVWAALRRMILDPSEVLSNARALADRTSSQSVAWESDRARRRAELDAVAAERARLVHLFTTGRIPEQMYDTLAAELAQRAALAQDALGALEAQRAAAEAEALPVDDVAAWCARWAGTIDDLDPEEQRALVEMIVREVVVYADHAEIVGRFSLWDTRVVLDDPRKRPGSGGRNGGARARDSAAAAPAAQPRVIGEGADDGHEPDGAGGMDGAEDICRSNTDVLDRQTTADASAAPASALDFALNVPLA